MNSFTSDKHFKLIITSFSVFLFTLATYAISGAHSIALMGFVGFTTISFLIVWKCSKNASKMLGGLWIIIVVGLWLTVMIAPSASSNVKPLPSSYFEQFK